MPKGVYERKPKRNIQALMFGIVDYFLEHQRYPTVRECVTFTDYQSFSAVTHAFKKLERIGKLESNKVGKHTRYKIVGLTVKPPDWYTEVKNESR